MQFLCSFWICCFSQLGHCHVSDHSWGDHHCVHVWQELHTGRHHDTKAMEKLSPIYPQIKTYSPHLDLQEGSASCAQVAPRWWLLWAMPCPSSVSCMLIPCMWTWSISTPVLLSAGNSGLALPSWCPHCLRQVPVHHVLHPEKYR